MEITLKEFLIKHKACEDGFDFAKDLTLEEFLNTCQRGDWILWLFVRMNPDSLRELTLAKGHCANTVRELMNDERSVKAVDVAIAFGEGRATREELDDAADVAADVAWAAARAADVVARAAVAAYAAADVAWAAADVVARAAADVVARAARAAADVAWAAAAVAGAVAAYAAAVAGAGAGAVAAAYAGAAVAGAGAVAAAYAGAAVAAWAAADVARKQNQKLTADICRQYLPLKIWNQSKI